MTHESSAVRLLLEVVYPPPVSTDEGRDATVFTALPSVRSARLVQSRGSRRASARAAWRQLNGRRLRTRFARVVVSITAAAGLDRRVPRTSIELPIRVGGEFDREIAARLNCDSVHLTIPVGPQRANQKPIVQVCDRTGAALAFVKLGHNDLTRRLVQSESRALSMIAAVGRSAGVDAPDVYDEFEWHGSYAIVLRPLDVPSRRLSGDTAKSRLLRLVREITGIVGEPRMFAWDSHPLRGELVGAFDSLGERGKPYAAILNELNCPDSLTTGAWHGDLNSGNLALTTGACPVWDWERFDRDVPMGFDLVHHDLQEWITVDGMSPGAAAERLVERAPDVLAGLVQPGSARLVAMAYLLTIAERYLRDDQQNAGAALGAVGAWLLPALRRGVERGRQGWST